MSQPLHERAYWALERWITPGAESSQNVYARIVDSHLTEDTRWLDIGCGQQLWSDWIPITAAVHHVKSLVGLDPDAESLRANQVIRQRVIGTKLPFRDGSFDLVTANMVFEHLEDPVAALQDIRRVLAPGGVCIFHTPNSAYWMFAMGRVLPQPLKNLLVFVSEGRQSKDVYPTFYRMNTEETARELPRLAGLKVDRLTMLNTSSTGRIVLLGPLVLLELLWLRLTRREGLRGLRTNIIGEVRAPGKAPVSRETRPHDLSIEAGLDPELAGVLACPECKARLREVTHTELECGDCLRRYPIDRGIPMIVAT